MISMGRKRMLRWVAWMGISLGVGFLLSTVLRSGLFFQLDPDELAHAHIAYLIINRYIPYKDFLLIYTPFFHWIIAPLLLIGGFTLEAVESIRWLMVCLFLTRVIVSFFLVRQLFQTRIAVLFVLLFLMDPFTVFTAMQIRPDNVMLVSFTVGLYTLFQGLRSNRKSWFFWSGILMALACIFLLKIIPGVFVVWILLAWFAFRKRNGKLLVPFGFGFCIPVVILGIYGLATNSLRAMLEQVIGYSVAINNAIAYAVPLAHFYKLYDPSLFDFYGSPGTVLTLYEYALPIGALVGILLVLADFFKRKSDDTAGVLRIILVGTLVIQSILLLFIHSVFIQYLLPVSWLCALFTAVAMVKYLEAFRKSTIIHVSLILVSIIAIGIVYRDSFRTNIIRSNARRGVLESVLPDLWRNIPASDSVYPNIVFRPIAYPMVFGYYLHDTPQSIKSRLPPLMPTLEKNNVRFIQKTYEWIAMPPEFPAYVEAHFDPVDSTLFRRKNK